MKTNWITICDSCGKLIRLFTTHACHQQDHSRTTKKPKPRPKKPRARKK